METTFISYCWKNETIADKLEILFNSNGISTARDKRGVRFTESIKDFMKKVRKTDFCLMIISDSYLKSINCMYEVLEFIKDDDFTERILPIITSDAKIFSATDRAIYIKYWQDRLHDIDTARTGLNPTDQADIIKEMRMIETIKQNISEFLLQLSDMKCIVLNAEINIKLFEDVLSKVRPDSRLDLTHDGAIGYLMLNVPYSITENILHWWKSDSAGYTPDIKFAKIFTENEARNLFESAGLPEWEMKKFTAIPLGQVIELGQTIIPYNRMFIKPLKSKPSTLIGNKDIYLTDEEVEHYG